MPQHAVFVPHSHWDREWYEPFQVFRHRLVTALDTVIATAEADPNFRFTVDGQIAAIEDYLEIRPDQRARVEELVARGQLAIGPWLILLDEFLCSGETLIRNLQMGWAAAEALGGALAVGYLPDMFGDVAQMPQSVNIHPHRDEPAAGEILAPAAQELGTRIENRIAITPSTTGWREAEAATWAEHFRNGSLVVRGTGTAASEVPEPVAGLRVDGGDVVVSSIRRVTVASEEGTEVRLVAMSAGGATATITGDFRAAVDVDLLERPQRDRLRCRAPRTRRLGDPYHRAPMNPFGCP